MFTSFKELEAYVLGCGMKKRIALANAHDEPALSAVVNARRKGVVEGTLLSEYTDSGEGVLLFIHHLQNRHNQDIAQEVHQQLL